MKTKLNLFCICIIVTLALSTSMVVSMFYQIIAAGVKTGYESAMKGTPLEIPNYQIAFTFPSDMLAETGTITNIKDSSAVAIKPLMSMVAMPAPKNGGIIHYLGEVCSLILVVVSIYALIQFFKLIRSINRGIIFDWLNVKILRKLGWALVVSFIGYFSSMAITNHELSKQISLNGCEFSMTVVFSDSTLILGFVSLLVAEIFAIGLKMKEEQELTI